VVTPVNRPADVSLVDMQLGRDLGVNVTNDQIGGSATVSIAPDNQPGGAFGSWTITVKTPAAPVAQAAPALVGQRLTAPPVDPTLPDTGLADDPHRPVYRFDVSGAQWGVANAGQLTTVLPAMTAQGSTDGTTWTDLGKLMPVTHPTVSGSTVTLGSASFFWQADPGQQPLTDVRVVSGGLASNVVHLADLAAPPTNGGTNATAVSSISLISATANAALAAPRADGVDQAPLNVALSPANAGGVIPTSDPRYQLVYYRDASSNELITGLYTPGDYQDYVSVSQWRGAYPNDGLNARLGGSRGGGTTPCPKHRHREPNKHCGGSGGGLGSGAPGQAHAYLVTTSGLSQSLNAVLNDSGTAGAVFTSSNLSVLGSTASITWSGTARAGLSLNGCPSGSCTLVTPSTTAPGLYQDGSAAAGPVVGLMFALHATTAQSILPLQISTDHQQHPLAESAITITNNQAQLSNAAVFWPDDRIDTSLLTAGQLVRVPGIQ